MFVVARDLRRDVRWHSQPMPDILGGLAIGEPAFRRLQPVERRGRVQRVLPRWA